MSDEKRETTISPDNLVKTATDVCNKAWQPPLSANALYSAECKLDALMELADDWGLIEAFHKITTIKSRFLDRLLLPAGHPDKTKPYTFEA